tara:strand:+ start:209 stop:904 length:696 start_codon:yes stop_codon:yes gene_type:complete
MRCLFALNSRARRVPRARVLIVVVVIVTCHVLIRSSWTPPEARRADSTYGTRDPRADAAHRRGERRGQSEHETLPCRGERTQGNNHRRCDEGHEIRSAVHALARTDDNPVRDAFHDARGSKRAGLEPPADSHEPIDHHIDGSDNAVPNPPRECEDGSVYCLEYELYAARRDERANRESRRGNRAQRRRRRFPVNSRRDKTHRPVDVPHTQTDTVCGCVQNKTCYYRTQRSN